MPPHRTLLPPLGSANRPLKTGINTLVDQLADIFASHLEGALTVDYGPAGSRAYEAGDAFLEAFGSDHDGRNAGDAPMRLLAVYMGAEGVPNTVMRGD